ACAAGARLYARCRVERVSIQCGCAAGVEAMLLERDGDAAHGRVRVCAPLVVVAAGAIHTPGLLARSGVRHPALGRNLRIHPAVGVAGYFAEELLAWRGTLQSYLVDRLQDSHGVMIEVTNPVPGVSAAALPGVGLALKDGLARFRHAASAGLFVSDTGSGRVRRLPGRREPLPDLRRREPAGLDHGVRGAHRPAAGQRFPSPAGPWHMGAVKTVLVFMLVGALAGAVAASFIVPPILSWYSEPGAIAPGKQV